MVVLLLVGCIQAPQPLETQQHEATDGAAYAQVQAGSEKDTPSALSTEVATQTPLPIPAVIAGTEDAPSYETIQTTLTSLHVEDSQAEDQPISPQLQLYLESLKGKKVQWEGWVASMVPDNIAQQTYAVNIQMEEPQPGRVGDVRVTLWGVSLEQASQLEIWPDMVNGSEAWQRVRFSGTISAVTIWRTVLIIDPKIEPLIESNSTPPFGEIQGKRKASSFQEWKWYADGLIGTEVIGWTGKVYKTDRFPDTEQYFLDVYLDSPASLKHEDSQPDLQIFFTTGDNREWSPGQNVTVTGTVTGVNYDSGFINLIDPVVEVADQ